MANVLADTSVWIEALKGGLTRVQSEKFSSLVRDRQVVITDVIRCELLVGTRNQKEFDWMRRHLLPFDCLFVEQKDRHQLDEFAWKLAREGLKGKYTDVSIAFLSRLHRVFILSFDRYFNKLADKKIIKQISLDDL